MWELCKTSSWFIGRVLLSLIFISSGVMKIMNWSQTAAQMSEKGMVAVQLFLALATIIEIGAGLGVLLGWYARCSAFTLALYLIPVTLVFHNFWALSGPEMQNQMQHFMKNLTIFGGLLTLGAVGAGPISVDTKRPVARQIEVRRPERVPEPAMR
jgi:putative oxidoreductase